MYQERVHASDSSIGVILQEIKGRFTDPYSIAEELKKTGCEVTADGSGFITICLGKEVCNYPLGITELP